MSNALIHVEINAIVSRLRWLENRDNAICYKTRYDAMRVALGLINRVADQKRFSNSRAKLFAIMNDAKRNIGV